MSCVRAPNMLIFTWLAYLLVAIRKASLRDPPTLQYATHTPLTGTKLFPHLPEVLSIQSLGSRTLPLSFLLYVEIHSHYS
ncbi:hypothetical protein BC827DRAFT_1235948 [Russula dissimulans]|nr:hypothetical protein BC827DRAFT_1235948 [Russula dissimulans]